MVAGDVEFVFASRNERSFNSKLELWRRECLLPVNVIVVYVL